MPQCSLGLPAYNVVQPLQCVCILSNMVMRTYHIVQKVALTLEQLLLISHPGLWPPPGYQVMFPSNAHLSGICLSLVRYNSFNIDTIACCHCRRPPMCNQCTRGESYTQVYQRSIINTGVPEENHKHRCTRGVAYTQVCPRTCRYLIFRP